MKLEYSPLQSPYTRVYGKRRVSNQNNNNLNPKPKTKINTNKTITNFSLSNVVLTKPYTHARIHIVRRSGEPPKKINSNSKSKFIESTNNPTTLKHIKHNYKYSNLNKDTNNITNHPNNLNQTQQTPYTNKLVCKNNTNNTLNIKANTPNTKNLTTKACNHTNTNKGAHFKKIASKSLTIKTHTHKTYMTSTYKHTSTYSNKTPYSLNYTSIILSKQTKTSHKLKHQYIFTHRRKNINSKNTKTQTLAPPRTTTSKTINTKTNPYNKHIYQHLQKTLTYICTRTINQQKTNKINQIKLNTRSNKWNQKIYTNKSLKHKKEKR